MAEDVDRALEGRRILVVDDEPDVCETVQDLLPGAAVDVALGYEEARERYAAARYDVVVLDIAGVRGFDLLREFSPRTPCVMLTAYSLRPYAVKDALQGRAAVILQKHDLSRLPECIAEVLSRGGTAWGWFFGRLNLGAQVGAFWDRVRRIARGAALRKARETGAGPTPEQLARLSESGVRRLTDSSGAGLDVPYLIDGLKDQDREVRAYSAYALGLVKAQDAVGPLVEALSDPDAEVRDEARDALIEHGLKAVALLREAYRRGGPGAPFAIEALREIAGRYPAIGAPEGAVGESSRS